MDLLLSPEHVLRQYVQKYSSLQCGVCYSPSHQRPKRSLKSLRVARLPFTSYGQFSGMVPIQAEKLWYSSLGIALLKCIGETKTYLRLNYELKLWWIIFYFAVKFRPKTSSNSLKKSLWGDQTQNYADPCTINQIIYETDLTVFNNWNLAQFSC